MTIGMIKNILSGRKFLFIALFAAFFMAATSAGAQEIDSLAMAASQAVAGQDSLAMQKADSVAMAPQLSAKELKRMQRDSIWNYKDSVLRNTPRLLHTYVFDDTTKFKRMFLWNADTWFNKPVSIQLTTSGSLSSRTADMMREQTGWECRDLQCSTITGS